MLSASTYWHASIATTPQNLAARNSQPWSYTVQAPFVPSFIPYRIEPSFHVMKECWNWGSVEDGRQLVGGTCCLLTWVQRVCVCVAQLNSTILFGFVLILPKHSFH